MPSGCLSILLLAMFLALVPFLLADAMLVALDKLGLSPGASLLAIGGIVLGGFVNIPVSRTQRDELVELPSFSLFGLDRFPQLIRRRTYSVIAVNLGGCVVPCALVVYEILRIAPRGGAELAWLTLGIVANTAICNAASRPVAGLGVVMRPFVPAFAAAVWALLFAPEIAPPVAFVIGVLGPLIGADLLRLREIRAGHRGIASIGGAGTFDGIVLSGMVATLLA